MNQPKFLSRLLAVIPLSLALAQEPQAAVPASPAVPDIIASIDFSGSRRVPQESLRALIATRVGTSYDPDLIDLDAAALWRTKRFDGIRIEREPSANGWIVRFHLIERAVVPNISGAHTAPITVPEILDRFNERRR